MYRITSFLLFLACLFIFSCEKVIDLVPESQTPKLVVDGSIESGQPPRVILTKSLDYFSKLTPTMLTESFVRNAEVTVSDGSRSIRLREYGIPIPGGTVFIYSVDTSNPAALMVGELNKTYNLTINTGGETFEATTNIPALTKKSDSLWWETAPNNPDTNRVVVFARVFDPPGLGNYIRYFTARNDSAYFPGLNSVYDDNIVDGITYDIQVFRGQDRNQDFDQDEFGFFRKGDRVKVKLTNIDKATYDFWRTWEQNQQNVGNPFSVPIKVLSNISNGAIGIWGGYSAQELSINIPQ
jgi:hypothetical protein